MAAYSYHADHNKWLTAITGGKEGDLISLSIGSFAYSLPRSTHFGWQSCRWTDFVLPTPVGVDQFGAALFDLNGLGCCPLDGSRQKPDPEI